MRAARGVKSLVNCFPGFRAFRLSVICVGQTLKMLGFKDPAREIPTAERIYSAPCGVAPLPTRLFFAAGWQSGMKGNSATVLRG
jgi:hypothetical protein